MTTSCASSGPSVWTSRPLEHAGHARGRSDRPPVGEQVVWSSAQAKVEGRNFDIRKQLLKFDDVMNDQRKVIFRSASRDHGSAGRIARLHARHAVSGGRRSD